MILCLDCGNSRLKWGLAGPHGWVSQGNIPNQEIGTLALRDWQNLPRPARVVGVNVAGEATRVRVEAQLVRWRATPEWLIAREEACGVYNRYARPSQLGADRWAALIAAGRLLANTCSETTASNFSSPTCRNTRHGWMRNSPGRRRTTDHGCKYNRPLPYSPSKKR